MNNDLQAILDVIQQSSHLSAEEKLALSRSLKDTGRELEVQNRELDIEASLERLRAKAMGMKRPDDLLGICEVLYVELQRLGVSEIRNAMVNIHDDDEEHFLNYDYSRNSGATLTTVSYNSHPVTASMIRQVRAAEDAFAQFEIRGAELDEWRAYRKGMGEDDDPMLNNVAALSYYIYSLGSGSIGISTYSSITEEGQNLLKRFRNVFDLAFRRYLDITQAETQARQAQIETALERVRARTMAMYKSDELAETAAVLFRQLIQLGIEPNRLYIAIIKDEEANAEFWITDEDGSRVGTAFETNLNSNGTFEVMYAGWKEKKRSIVIDMRGKELQAYFEHLGRLNVPFKVGLSQKRRVQHIAYFSQGFIGMASPDEQPQSAMELLERFAGVFNLTYTRFIDLQQAEAQATESKIEAALERVRSQAMSMHSSEDLAKTIVAFYHELHLLGVTPIRCGVGLINKETHVAEISSMNTTGEGGSLAVIGNLDLTMHPILAGIFESWMLQKDYYPILRGAEIKEYYQILTPQIRFPDYSNDLVHYGYFFFFAEGGVYAWTDKPMAEIGLRIYRRFTSVLTLTYKRYKDLKQAEEQAREATIEAALEKVRGSAMAMRNSDDLTSTASMVFTELRKLGINPIRAGVGIISKASQELQIYSAISLANGDSLSLTGTVLMSEHPEFRKQYAHWVKGEDYFVVLNGKALQSYYAFVSAGFSYSDFAIKPDDVQYGHWLMFAEGLLFAWSDRAYSKTEISILERFKKIVELTFRRYFELQKSEASAREATKRAALDRVRADIASMRTTSDLERITPLVWNELNILGIPFIRCGVFIMDEEQELIHTFLSSPDGKAIASFHLPYASSVDFAQSVVHWRKKEIYKQYWDEAAFVGWTNELLKMGAIISQEAYSTEHRPSNLYLHFLPFLQGMLYVGNDAPLSEEYLQVVQSLADAFSTAYARYEDFNKLDAAKQQVEHTLADLKQAQQQLVQSEKMASLGELTAGIAHEIQNPLNFVSNFSEVNTELIEEMKGEIEKGNFEEAKAIADDIRENERKISHHGKRADAIVKGMLQHSRVSSGVKELTDINKIADEYLGLAYHGLRAKDNAFNATMKSDFDETIGSISVIPQDIGRVLLNLYTNAFYAVAEKRKGFHGNYEPTVMVSTKRVANGLCVSVKDNGNGIPQKVIDKIFQPFFTTKPTGQGTGLGLSLSYDIIKAHGGEIRVDTVEGEGTEFILTFNSGGS